MSVCLRLQYGNYLVRVRNCRRIVQRHQNKGKTIPVPMSNSYKRKTSESDVDFTKKLNQKFYFFLNTFRVINIQ